MSWTVITTLSGMGRWEPDARGRMRRAAIELYADRGFEQTTVADIAERAGVTERTFFRHFADKREVLFDGSGHLQDVVVAGIAAAPADAPPLEAVVAGLDAGASLFDREHSRRRAAVIAAHPSLQERELLKMAALGAAVADALRERGVPDPAAALTADLGISVFRSAFEQWVADSGSGDTGHHLRKALAQLKETIAGS
jgi:AcrR family transcriptional regulator